MAIPSILDSKNLKPKNHLVRCLRNVASFHAEIIYRTVRSPSCGQEQRGFGDYCNQEGNEANESPLQNFDEANDVAVAASGTFVYCPTYMLVKIKLQ